MPAIVLESSLGSQYEDSPDSYEFPGRYLRFFDPVGRGEQLYAIVYEPRGESGTGRMAYVGMARVVTTPMQTGRRNRAGEDLWRVGYATAAEALTGQFLAKFSAIPLNHGCATCPAAATETLRPLGGLCARCQMRTLSASFASRL